jgi:hypothetical protein
VQGRLDPEGVAEDGRRRREGVGGLGAPGMRRRVGAGELLRGSFSFLDDQIPLSFFFASALCNFSSCSPTIATVGAFGVKILGPKSQRCNAWIFSCDKFVVKCSKF